ncbi:MAG: NTP transferase domain-containing protein [Nitrospiraceae bacterium]|nr:NTP transferase domain-containing protein [Nitrospiraceae bacterium]
MKDRITLTIDSNIIKEVDKTVDGFHIKNRSHAVELLLVKAIGNHRPKKAVILAASKGKRLRPLTYETPKPLIMIHDKPILQYDIELLRNFGIKDILLIVGYLKEKIMDYFGDGSKFGVRIQYSDEDPNRLPGTAGSLRFLKTFLDDTFVLMYGDNLYDINITDFYLFHKENNSLATVGLKNITTDLEHYGLAELRGNRIVRFVEKPSKLKSGLANAGIFIIEPDVLNMIPKKGFSMLENDVFPELVKEGRLFGYLFDGQWFDIRDAKTYEHAIKEWKPKNI